ncbi:MAG: ABC transporter permease [Ruminococcaceae bacterium]|nr:ABC transporter permease [Oscillospiraceae bacterium]
MKQFGKILKFELMGYAKNKIFVGITVFLMVAIAVVTFVPNIISAFSSDTGEDTVPSEPTSAPVMIISSSDPALSVTVQTYFIPVFTGYAVVISDEEPEAIKESIVSGEAECAFIMDSLSSYTYYVNNLSMYDSNTVIADEVLRELYRITAMVGGGLSPETASDILSVMIESRTETLGKDQMENFFYTYIMIFALYMVILLYGQMVATNVATEKSSRAMELLVTSADPTAMMFGKVIASCLAGLTQLILIFGTAMLFYNLNKSALENPIIASIFDIPFDLFIYMIVFFVLGFLIYAFMFGAIGSTASKLEDINTSVMPITFLFVIAFMVVVFSMASGSVDNTAMLICSYIPFTSPMAMFTRICMSTVMWYEIFISIFVLVASVIGIGFLSAKIYRVGVLLYGMPPKITTVVKTVFKKQ